MGNETPPSDCGSVTLALAFALALHLALALRLALALTVSQSHRLTHGDNDQTGTAPCAYTR